MKLKASSLFFMGVMLLILSLPAKGFSVTITDSVQNPGTALGSLAGVDDSFLYGDFTIKFAGDSFGDIEDISAGDGLDESWDWSFDYTGSYDSSEFNEFTILSSALLTLRLTANSDQVNVGDSEQVRMLWLDPINVQFLAVDTEVEVVLDLLDYYTSNQIIERFMSSDYDGTGTIPMRFLDDAVVNFAQLSLITAPVPEPSTMLLLGAGLVGLIGARRKMEK